MDSSSMEASMTVVSYASALTTMYDDIFHVSTNVFSDPLGPKQSWLLFIAKLKHAVGSNLL